MQSKKVPSLRALAYYRRGDLPCRKMLRMPCKDCILLLQFRLYPLFLPQWEMTSRWMKWTLFERLPDRSAGGYSGLVADHLKGADSPALDSRMCWGTLPGFLMTWGGAALILPQPLPCLVLALLHWVQRVSGPVLLLFPASFRIGRAGERKARCEPQSSACGE